VFSGFFINFDSLPPYFAWISYISPIRYSYAALLQNELEGLVFNCDAPNSTCPPGGGWPCQGNRHHLRRWWPGLLPPPSPPLAAASVWRQARGAGAVRERAWAVGRSSGFQPHPAALPPGLATRLQA
jgi:hypothetical protein